MFGFGGELRCRLWRTEILLWTGLMCSTYNLLAVSVERFLEVSDQRTSHACVGDGVVEFLRQMGRDPPVDRVCLLHTLMSRGF